MDEVAARYSSRLSKDSHEMAGIKDVARQAGVSPTTVSRYLNNHLELPEPTRSRIDAAIKQLGYRPNLLAKRLSTGTAEIIGVVAPEIANPFFTNLVAAIEDEAERHGYSVLLSSTRGMRTREIEQISRLEDRHVDGLILMTNQPDDGTLAAGDLLLADVGAESVGGFAGDVTRTWPVSGRFSPSQRAYYEVVLRAQKRAIEAVKPGARYLDVHLLASTELVKGLCELGVLRGDPSELIAEGVQALFFPHGIGHLLGLDVHDMEDLGDRAGYAKGRTRSKQFGLCYLRLDRDLVPGMAVTIEPGLYHVPAIFSHPELSKLVAKHVNQTELKKYSDVRGIRIEDDVLVTQTGHEVLTRAIVKEAGDVERAVGAQS